MRSDRRAGDLCVSAHVPEVPLVGTPTAQSATILSAQMAIISGPVRMAATGQIHPSAHSADSLHNEL